MTRAVRRLPLMGAIVVILIGGIVAYDVQTRPDLLPLHARRVLDFDASQTRFWWLTENELLLLREAGPGGHVFARHNVDNGSETPLTALTAIYRASAGKIETVRPSPTGDWLLWTGYGNSTYLASLDGGRHYRVQESGPRLNLWKYAGNGWYALHLGYQTIAQVSEHNLDDPGKTVPVNAIAYPIPNDPEAVNLDHITPASDTQLLVPLWAMGKGKLDRADIMVTGFGASPQSVRKLRIPAPYLNSGGELAFSPRSNQMAWRIDILLPRARFWEDLGLSSGSRYSVGFWVGDQQSGRSVSSGYLDADRKDPTSRPTDLEFSPLGKYFSFVQHKAVWIVPTDR